MILETIQELGQWNWMIAAGILFILEFLLPGFFLLFFGLAALITGVASFIIPMEWQYQFVIFALLSVANMYIARKFWNPHAPNDEPLLNQRGSQHIGKNFKLVTPLTNGRGKVKAGDTLWRVEGSDELAEGESVKVIGARDSVLLVEKT